MTFQSSSISLQRGQPAFVPANLPHSSHLPHINNRSLDFNRRRRSRKIDLLLPVSRCGICFSSVRRRSMGEFCGSSSDLDCLCRTCFQIWKLDSSCSVGDEHPRSYENEKREPTK